MLEQVIVVLSIIGIVCLVAEAILAARHRRVLKHVVYVNGTRGKSTVTRLIDAGLRAGGFRSFCKTTGTLPMTINIQNEERPLARHGRVNIKEQLAILSRAARESADVLVIECMAVNPELQRISQHRMVRADIGVITNVRLDHTDEMGETLEEICDALSNTIPKNGVLFTADADFHGQLARNAAGLGTEVILTLPDGCLPDFDFPENIALALGVCERLGVDRCAALEGMRHYRRDPYALSLFRLAGDALFINGLSINDPTSTELVYRSLCGKLELAGHRLVLLVNNRPDREYRTAHMLLLASRLLPDEVWVMGASRALMCRKLRSLLPKATRVRSLRQAGEAPLASLGADDVLFAVGNIALQGRALMNRIEKEAMPYVQ